MPRGGVYQVCSGAEIGRRPSPIMGSGCLSHPQQPWKKGSDMIRNMVLAAAMGAAVGLAACEEKKSPPAAPAAPAGGAGTTAPAGGVSGAADAAKKAAADTGNKQRDDMVAKLNTSLGDMEKSSTDWKAKIDAMSGDAKAAATKLNDDFKAALASAKDNVSKLKDATTATFADLSSKANDAVKKATD